MLSQQDARYDVFISYRRSGGDGYAIAIREGLKKRGLKIFMDVDLGPGLIDEKLLQRIEQAPCFLVILTEHALDRCGDEEDWLRKEIVHALATQRIIIPIMFPPFKFTKKLVNGLDPAIKNLARYQGVEFSRFYFETTIQHTVDLIEEGKAAQEQERQAHMRAEEERHWQREAEEVENQRLAVERAERVAEQERLARPRAEEERQRQVAELKKQKAAAKQARRLVREVAPRRWPWMKLVPVFSALAAIMVAAVMVPPMLSEYRIHQAQKQVAAVFTERRTTEMRLTSVDYARYNPFPIILGNENERSLDELPPTLHNASSAANENLKSAHPDPRWLQIQGRALLWEATPSSLDKAEKNFEKAQAEGLNTPSLKIDLAASYFEHDSKSEHPNLQRTFNLLFEILSAQGLSDQERASAFYNLAIAYEKTQAWNLAVSAWEEYIQGDSSSSWAEEARRRLKDARIQISAKRQELRLSASFLHQLARNGFQPEDLKQYQQEPLAQLLPVALHDGNRESYRALAGVLAEKHSDPWLKEFLAALPTCVIGPSAPVLRI